MKPASALANLGAFSAAVAALTPGPAFTRLNKNDAVSSLP